jgi:hypothetical protein
VGKMSLALRVVPTVERLSDLGVTCLEFDADGPPRLDACEWQKFAHHHSKAVPTPASNSPRTPPAARL